MCRFIETIGKPDRLLLHNARMNATRRCFFGSVPDLDLQTVVDGCRAPEGCCRYRAFYAEFIERIEYFPYRLRPVHTLRLVAADDVLMVRQGRLIDTSIANIALFNGQEWLTPSHPLLAGTRRADLLPRGLIRPADLLVADLLQFCRIRLFNAMIPFGEVESDCRQILME